MPKAITAKLLAKCVQVHDSRELCIGLVNAYLAGIIGPRYALEDGSAAWCLQEYGGQQHRIRFCPFCGVPFA